MIPYCEPVGHLIAVTFPSSLGEVFFIVIAMVLNFSYPLISTQFSFHVRCQRNLTLIQHFLLFQNLKQGLKYIHSLGLVHMDIKPGKL